MRAFLVKKLYLCALSLSPNNRAHAIVIYRNIVLSFVMGSIETRENHLEIFPFP